MSTRPPRSRTSRSRVCRVRVRPKATQTSRATSAAPLDLVAGAPAAPHAGGTSRPPRRAMPRAGGSRTSRSFPPRRRADARACRVERLPFAERGHRQGRRFQAQRRGALRQRVLHRRGDVQGAAAALDHPDGQDQPAGSALGRHARRRGHVVRQCRRGPEGLRRHAGHGRHRRPAQHGRHRPEPQFLRRRHRMQQARRPTPRRTTPPFSESHERRADHRAPQQCRRARADRRRRPRLDGRACRRTWRRSRPPTRRVRSPATTPSCFSPPPIPLSATSESRATGALGQGHQRDDRARRSKGDCSLSNYALLTDHPDYLNVTVDHDQRDTQRKIIDVIMAGRNDAVATQ